MGYSYELMKEVDLSLPKTYNAKKMGITRPTLDLWITKYNAERHQRLGATLEELVNTNPFLEMLFNQAVREANLSKNI